MSSDTPIETPALVSLQKRFNPFRLAALVTALDDRLRLRLGVIEYTNAPDCLFRIQFAHSQYDLTLSDGTRIRVDDPIVHLHVWNEQCPAFPPDGPTFAWARRFTFAFERSLCKLSDFLAARADTRDIAAICGDLTFEPSWRAAQLTRFVKRFGFEAIRLPQQRWSFARRAHWFGENILISMMVLAHNAAALHPDTLWRDRIPVFLSRRTLDSRYGTGHRPQQTPLITGNSSQQPCTATL